MMFFVCIGCAFCLAAPAALADSGKVFHLNATIPTVCSLSIDTGAVMDFGSILPGVPIATRSVNGNAQCSKDAVYQISIKDGAENRSMKHLTQPESVLGYRLCSDATCNTPFFQTGLGLGSDVDISFTVHGKLDETSILNALAGAYVDTVTVLIAFQ